MTDMIPCGRYALRVLYLDNHLLVIEKPPNAPVQRDSSGDMDVLTACKAYIKEKFQKPGDVYLGLVHRLDRPVGGVMVLARTSKAAARLSQAFSSHEVDKRYLAVVRGVLDAPMEMTDWLYKDERTGSSRVVSREDPGAKEARLLSAPVAHAEEPEPLTLVEVRLYTGRSHQIRVQHAHAGYPLWGDARYGGGTPGQQIALWAYRLTIAHPTQKNPVCIECPPPEEGVWRRFPRRT